MAGYPCCCNICEDLVEDFLHYWTFDEAITETRADEVGSTDLVDGELSFDTGSSAGQQNDCADFNLQARSLVNTNPDDDIKADESQYWMGWFYLRSNTDGIEPIVEKMEGGSAAEFELYFNPDTSNSLVLTWYTEQEVSPGLWLPSPTNLSVTGQLTSTGTWYFIEFWKTDSEIGFCVDRGTDQTISLPGRDMNAGDATLRFGRRGSSPINYTDGKVDEWGVMAEKPATDIRDYLYNSGAGRSWNDIQSESCCCAVIRVLAADVDITGLPSIPDMEINILNGTGCSASSDGILDDVTHTSNGWEHPPTGIPGPSKAAINADVNLVFTISRYDPVRWISRVVYFGTVECWYGWPDEDGADWNTAANFYLQEQDLAGSLSLITGNEPTMYPYHVKLEYKIYEDGQGDCILRVGAHITPNIDGEGNCTTQGTINVNFGNVLASGGGSWPLTSTPFQYSSHLPCLTPPLPLSPEQLVDDGNGNFWIANPGNDPDPGSWKSGERITLEDQCIASTEAFPPGTLCEVGDLDSDDDPINTGIITSTELSWFWEINLTDSSITDLDNLPNTVLDWTNVMGVGGTIHAPGPVPGASYFDTTWRYWSPGSWALSPGSEIRWRNQGGDATPLYALENDGAGGHICQFDSSPGNCAPGITYQAGGGVVSDTLNWLYNAEATGSGFTVSYKDISITLKSTGP